MIIASYEIMRCNRIPVADSSRVFFLSRIWHKLANHLFIRYNCAG